MDVSVLDSVRLLTLDLDDTILDSDGVAGPRLTDSAEAAAGALGGRAAKAVIEKALALALVADPVTEGRLQTFLRALDVAIESPEGVAIRAAYNGRFLDLVQPLPSALDAVVRLRRRFKLVIVTNGPVVLQIAKIARWGIEPLVDGIVISEAVGFRKPAREIFEHACGLVSIPTSAGAHVGDSPEADLEGARNAGMRAVWCVPSRWQGPPPQPAPDLVVGSLAELVERLGL